MFCRDLEKKQSCGKKSNQQYQYLKQSYTILIIDNIYWFYFQLIFFAASFTLMWEWVILDLKRCQRYKKFISLKKIVCLLFLFFFPRTRLIKKEVCYICHPHLLQFLSTFTQVFSDKCEQQLDHPTKKLSTSNANSSLQTQSLKIREMFNFSHLVSGIQQFLSLHYRPFIRSQCSIQMLHFKAFLKPEINYMIRQQRMS